MLYQNIHEISIFNQVQKSAFNLNYVGNLSLLLCKNTTDKYWKTDQELTMSATTIGIFQTIIVAFYCHGLYDSNMDLSH